MNAGDQDKLDELLELTRENNKVLRRMNRKMIWGQVFTVLYWLVILGVVGWSYYYFQPYLEEYIGVYKKLMQLVSGGSETVGNLIPADMKGVLETVQKLPR